MQPLSRMRPLDELSGVVYSAAHACALDGRQCVGLCSHCGENRASQQQHAKHCCLEPLPQHTMAYTHRGCVQAMLPLTPARPGPRRQLGEGYGLCSRSARRLLLECPHLPSPGTHTKLSCPQPAFNTLVSQRLQTSIPSTTRAICGTP